MNASILIDNNTRDLLKNLGKKGQTYDQVIRELIQEKNRIDSTQDKTISNTANGI